MVLTQDGEDLFSQGILNYFDTATYGAWGDGGDIISPGNTALNNEVYRSIMESATKNLSTGTYDIQFRLPAPRASGVTINEIAVFDAITGGNLFVTHLPTSTTFGLEEVWITLQISVVIT